MLQPQHPFPPRGRMENCRSSLSLRGLKQKRRRRPEQHLPATKAPQTEPEKGGLVNRLVTSSPPTLILCCCPCFPVYIEPYLNPFAPPGCHLLYSAKKVNGCGNVCWTGGNVQSQDERVHWKKSRPNGKWHLGAAYCKSKCFEPM